ncbi:MAG: DNA/RNA non-specific endonuclease [Chloroflexi bacterium]|nr:DNA/RNA non-specific endonuclease [Chloroflexota bacterium]
MLYDSAMQNRLRRFILVLFVIRAPLLAEDNLKYGQPACVGPVLDKKYFVVCYDPAHRIPAWVGYALTKGDSLVKATSRQGGFRADTALPRGGRAENADYSKSGYDKGHMAPANDFTRSVEAMKSTFVLTNAVPQKHGVNGGQWAQLEAAVHALASAGGAIWVFSGPVFAGKTPVGTIGRDKVAVPSHTYKVVLCVHPNGHKEMFGFVLPNINKPSGAITSYTFSVDQVEKLTGLDFFGSLPAGEQNQLEGVAGALPAR